MANQSTSLSRVFHALSDPTRRAVISRLSRGPAAMSELARPFDMALPSFAQHLSVLERASLVRSRKRGRVRTFRLAPKALVTADAWLNAQRALWTKRLDQLDTYLASMKEDER